MTLMIMMLEEAAEKEILELENKLKELKQLAIQKEEEEEEEEEWEKELEELRQLNANQWDEGLKTNFEGFSHTKTKFDNGDLKRRAEKLNTIFNLATKKSSKFNNNININNKPKSTSNNSINNVKKNNSKNFSTFMRF